MGRRLFCEHGPLCYKISLLKEYAIRDAGDILSGLRFAKERRQTPLQVIVKGHRSPIMRKLDGVDMRLQKNKEKNIAIASGKINGLLIKPGETFSFWKTVGETKEKDGYLEGLSIFGTRLGSSIGGGLCQLANLINWMVLNSPLTVTEIHHHTDALFPDSERRVPFGTGTSIFFKNIDYRFRNDTDQCVQLLVWISEGDLCGELRSEKPFSYRYRIAEEDSHYTYENGAYYRVSKIYKLTFGAAGELLDKKLVLKNHSQVMYDPALIPKMEIRA